MAERLPVFLFDLGGVLIQFTGFKEIQPMLARPMSIAEIAAKWNSSSAIKDFRIGAIRPREFAERFVAEWQLTVTPDVFLGAFRLWIHDFCPSTRALLTELRELGYRVACISETNEVHWSRLVNEFGLT